MEPPTGGSPLEAARPGIPVIFDGLAQRAGYQAGFLELDGNAAVPLPDLTADGRMHAARLKDDTCELRYHKFSIVMHAERRLALFTAANVDWRREFRMLSGKAPTRRELTGLEDGTPEQWVIDPRIPADAQLSDAFFTRDAGAFDKGHLVRRDDVCWGTSFRDMQKANGDTYHITNCSPQVAGFNRAAKGEDNWGDLENLVQKETKSEKAIIFCGPVLADGDRSFRGWADTGEVLVQVPTRFWKIVAVRSERGARAYGFLVEQDLSRVPLEMGVPVAWRKYVKPIEEIEGLLLGLARLTWLERHDAFGQDDSDRIAAQLQ